MTFRAHMRKIRRMIRYRIIKQLDKLDRWCWADLVTWAQGYDSFSFKDIRPIRTCLWHDGPYCGKCEKFLPPEGRHENVKNPIWDSEKCMWVEEGAES